MMRAAGSELIATLEGRSGCEFVSEFSEHYPIRVLSASLGIPTEDIPLFSSAAIDLTLMGSAPLAPAFSQIEAAMKTLSAYVIELLQKRRRAPQDDFLSALNETQDTEGQLTEDEIVWNVVNLLFAGQDTTRIQLAAAVWAFVENGIWDDLRACPSRIAQALDESLRFYPVLQFVVRKPLEAVELDGFRFPPGRRVVVTRRLRAAIRRCSSIRTASIRTV